MDMDSLLQSVMDSKIATLLYENAGTQQAASKPKREAYSGRSAFLSRMRGDAAVSRQGAQNMEDAAGMVTTAQTGVTAIKQMLTDMRKIATDVQANAHSLTPDQFAAYSSQMQDYAKQMEKMSRTLNFNGFNLLDGSAGMNKDGVLQLQAGSSSVTEVLTNMLDTSVAAGKVVDGNKMNLANMSGLLTVTNAADAQKALDLISEVFDRVGSIEARYSNDIKSLNNLSVLLEGRADIFDTAQKNQTDEKAQSQPTSYLDMLMQATGTPGAIFTGKS